METTAENLKEQRHDYRTLALLERTVDNLSNITLTSNQLNHIYNDLNRKCEESGDKIKLRDVFQVVVDGVKLILEKDQVEFIASHGIKLTLKDVDIIIRPVAPRDRARFIEGLNNLSDNTVFLRFLSPNRQLSSSQVDYLINVDFEDHFAFAVVADKPSYPGMAITRYIRSYENPKEAEWAVTVVDSYQGLGLGRILLYLMNLIAYKHGVEVFTATIHPSNKRILSWMKELHATSHRVEDGIVWKFCLPIPEQFLANETIRAKLQLIAEGKGDIPLFVAADMNNDNYERMMSMLC